MKSLQTWSPMRDLWDLHDDVDRLFHGFGFRGGRKQGNLASVAWIPPVDIREDKVAVILSAELPGIKKEDIKLGIENGVLTVKGERSFEDEQKKENYYRIERSYGSFSRSFELPSTVDPEKIKANMKDGVLEIYIPKKDEAKPKKVEIEVS